MARAALARLADQAAARVGADVVEGVLRALTRAKPEPWPESQPERMVEIYILRDPATGKIGYVGRSVDAFARYAQHTTIPAARITNPTPKDQWIARVALANGRGPEMEIVERVPMSQQRDAEQRWIDRLLAEGHPLTNVARP